MTTLADAVLPLIRSHADLHRWSSANEHGRQMHDAIAILEDALPTADPLDAYTVAHKALSSAIKVIARADDSGGIIGDACQRLLWLHPKLAAAAHVPVGPLVNWMIRFQFDGEVDYFELDPAAYALALGEPGIAAYRSRLKQLADNLPPGSGADNWRDPDRHTRWVLEWNARRLAVLDRDIDAIIRTHGRDRAVAAWLHETATALAEIGEADLAIQWAEQATNFDRGHQSQRAADYWCDLLQEHHPQRLVGARAHVFRRWPTALNASRLHTAAAGTWSEYESDVTQTLQQNPTEAVNFALGTLNDAEKAWELAHRLNLTNEHTWGQLVLAYERIDPLATLDIHRQLVESTLTNTGADHYCDAANRLARMRRLATGSTRGDDVDEFIAELRATHRRRPRLQLEFDRAKLP
jgi:hypothetical protein